MWQQQWWIYQEIWLCFQEKVKWGPTFIHSKQPIWTLPTVSCKRAILHVIPAQVVQLSCVPLRPGIGLNRVDLETITAHNIFKSSSRLNWPSLDLRFSHYPASLWLMFVCFIKEIKDWKTGNQKQLCLHYYRYLATSQHPQSSYSTRLGRYIFVFGHSKEIKKCIKKLRKNVKMLFILRFGVRVHPWARWLAYHISGWLHQLFLRQHLICLTDISSL